MVGAGVEFSQAWYLLLACTLYASTNSASSPGDHFRLTSIFSKVGDLQRIGLAEACVNAQDILTTKQKQH
jgi:hypothetical protein